MSFPKSLSYYRTRIMGFIISGVFLIGIGVPGLFLGEQVSSRLGVSLAILSTSVGVCLLLVSLLYFKLYGLHQNHSRKSSSSKISRQSSTDDDKARLEPESPRKQKCSDKVYHSGDSLDAMNSGESKRKPKTPQEQKQSAELHYSRDSLTAGNSGLSPGSQNTDFEEVPSPVPDVHSDSPPKYDSLFTEG